MKAKLITLTTLLALSACDVPQRTRYPSSPEIPITSAVDNDNAQNPPSENGDTGEESGNDGSSQNYGPGFSECNLGHRYNGGTIGNFGICQSELDKRKLKASFAESDISDGTCFVAMHMQNGKSFQLGIPECVHNQKDSIYNVPLTVTRPEPINAVMVLKYSATGAFQACMSAKTNFMNGYINYTYSSSCRVSPDAYANCVCSTFVNNYGDAYKQVVFED